MKAGDTVGERYQILDKLGAGGMGTLWRARHLELDLDVALKVVSPADDDEHSLARFEREAKAVARLKSPHIVSVMDYGVFDGRPVLVMELLEGEDLAALIRRQGRVEPEHCRRIIDQICKAVQVAHDAGVIHRDLKPANVFLEKVGNDEVVKVLDFGVAKDLEHEGRGHKTSSGALLGSPAYMSPEQVWNQKLGYPSDIWALGVIALEMLTAQQPFDDDSMAKIFEHIVRDPLPQPSALNGRLPCELDDFFEQVFQRDPSKRIQSPKQFAALFEQALVGVQPSSAPSAAARTLSQADDTALSASSPAAVLLDRQRTPQASGWRGWLVALVIGALAVSIGVLVTRAKPKPEGSTHEPPLASTPSNTLASVAAPAAALSPKPSTLERDDSNRVLDAKARELAPVVPVAPVATSGLDPKPPTLIQKRSSPSPTRSLPPPASAAASPSAERRLTIDPKFGVPVTE